MGFFGLRPPAVQGSILPRQANWGSACGEASKAGSPKTELFSGGSQSSARASQPQPHRLAGYHWPGSPSPGEKILQRR